MDKLNSLLEKFSCHTTRWAGSSWAFATALGLLLAWAVAGPIFGFSEGWQLIVNTGTTIVTFLMVFLIQRSQNKESEAVQVKLNELLASQQGASNRLINAEDLSEGEIRDLHKKFSYLASQLENTRQNGEVHSIEEAQEALDEAQQTLGKASRSKEHKQGQPAGRSPEAES
jgi:low affinity Fe/Cu permease